MKRVSQMTALAMALGLACASSWAAELAKPLTLDQLQQQNGKAIDTRPSAFYNGWPQTLNGPSGHEPAALNLSASWLDKMSTEQLNAWIKQHNLKADAPVALYGNGKDVDAVKTRLQKAGFTHISILSDALSEPSRLQKLPHFEQLVYPQWLHDLQQGKVKRLRRNLSVTGKSLKRPRALLSFTLSAIFLALTTSIPTKWKANRCGTKFLMNN
ncbi:TPA: hypothetical protein JQH03_003996 [Shigella flexneri 2a]|nr:hypothetical protein [Shigella flexneri]EKM7173720.1 hypothetical protein [Escherichia coli]HAY5828161.1 hypothetical protein [Shigella flexneri 2a]EFT0675282.1 hypothetical protein [Shigella flexneri]EFT4575259.1 hypothetical protein [Shigella flexneri]